MSVQTRLYTCTVRSGKRGYGKRQRVLYARSNLPFVFHMFKCVYIEWTVRSRSIAIDVRVDGAK